MTEFSEDALSSSGTEPTAQSRHLSLRAHTGAVLVGLTLASLYLLFIPRGLIAGLMWLYANSGLPEEFVSVIGLAAFAAILVLILWEFQPPFWGGRGGLTVRTYRALSRVASGPGMNPASLNQRGSTR